LKVLWYRISQRSHEWEQQALYGTRPLLADGKVSRRERGLLVFTCCTRRRDKVAVVNYMAARGEGNLDVHGCVLCTNYTYKLKFIQGPLRDGHLHGSVSRISASSLGDPGLESRS
jgi:hypothetical protein